MFADVVLICQGLGEQPLAPLPSAVASHIDRAAVPLAASAAIPEGRRSDTLTRYAGAMHRVGMSPSAIEVGLSLRKRSPLRSPLIDGDVTRIVKSISSYPRQPHDRGSDRLGGVLSEFPWNPLPFATLVDARFGIKPAESKAIQAVLAQHTGDMQWGSFSQLFRAAQFGIPPSTLEHPEEFQRRGTDLPHQAGKGFKYNGWTKRKQLLRRDLEKAGIRDFIQYRSRGYAAKRLQSRGFRSKSSRTTRVSFRAFPTAI